MQKTKIGEQDLEPIDYEERRHAVTQRKRDKRRKRELRRQEKRNMEHSNGN